MLAALALLGVAAALSVPFLLPEAEAEGEGDDASRDAADAPPEGGDAEQGDPEAGLTGLLEFLAAPPPDAPDAGAAPVGDFAAGELDLFDTGRIVSLPDPGPDPFGTEPVAPPDPAPSGDVGDDATGPGPLQPVDPDAPDDPGPDVPGLEPLSPVDPDAADVPGEDLEDVEPLSPVEDPDPFATASLSAHAAPVTGETGVDGFMPGRDVLEVTLFTSLAPDAVTLDVAPSADGQDGVVTANDQVIAILRGAPDATAGDVTLNLQAPPAS